MPNVENINLVIEAIRNEENFFNMVDFDKGMAIGQSPCGTPSCICGWANYLRLNSDLPTYGDLAYMYAAAAWLGIEDIDYQNLFTPEDHDMESDMEFWESITRAQAIETLERLRDTGKIEWRI